VQFSPPSFHSSLVGPNIFLVVFWTPVLRAHTAVVKIVFWTFHVCVCSVMSVE